MLLIYALAFQGIVFAINYLEWERLQTHWSVAKIISWIFINVEVSSELGRRHILEHNQLC